MEDASFGPYYFTQQTVWARQLNPENRAEHAINDGGQLWVLGLKTENPGSRGVNPSTILESRNGAKSEVLGGYQSTQGLNGNSINGSINCSQNGSSACPCISLSSPVPRCSPWRTGDTGTHRCT